MSTSCQLCQLPAASCAAQPAFTTASGGKEVADPHECRHIDALADRQPMVQRHVKHHVLLQLVLIVAPASTALRDQHRTLPTTQGCSTYPLPNN